MKGVNFIFFLKKFVWRGYCHLFHPSLRFLARRHGTDKLSHGYISAYARWFGPRRLQRLNILEIGVGGYDNPYDGGNSLRMWRDYFPHAIIHSIDIADKSPHQEKRIRIFRGSQNDPEFLSKLSQEVAQWDVVIDDGSHINEHIITSFTALFPFLSNGGVYVIEDLQTSYWRQYGGQLPESAEATSMEMIKRLLDGLHHAWIPGRKVSQLDRSISAIHAYPGIVFIQKGFNAPVVTSHTLEEIRRATEVSL